MNHSTKQLIGSYLYDIYGDLCEELISGGYDLESYYDGSDSYGDFGRVYVMVAYLQGVKSYGDYLKWFEKNKRIDSVSGAVDKPVTQTLFARLTGIKAKRVNNNQTARTRRYRQRQKAELEFTREAVAHTWIDKHPQEAQEYLNKITVVNGTKSKKTIDNI